MNKLNSNTHLDTFFGKIDKKTAVLIVFFLFIAGILLTGSLFQVSANGTASQGSSDELVLLEFSGQACPACRKIEPLLQQMREKNYPIQTVFLEKPGSREIFRKYDIATMPTFVLLKNNQEIDRLVGQGEDIPEIQPKLLEMFNRALAQKEINVPEVPQEATVSSPNSDSFSALAAPAPINVPASFPEAVSVPENGKSFSAASAPITAPMAATVRIRYIDPNGVINRGTGTIIHTNKTGQNYEALVLTCGHLFRVGEGKGKIEIDVFNSSTQQSITVPGECISFDGDIDLGFVGVPLPFEVAPIPLVPADYRAHAGDPMISIGCDQGNNPTPLQHQVVATDRHFFDSKKSGSAKNMFYYIEVSNAPVGGRSGGGLFIAGQNGYALSGVCNAADDKANEGFFVPASVIYENLLANPNLMFVYQDMMKRNQSADSALAASIPTANPVNPGDPAVNPAASGNYAVASTNPAYGQSFAGPIAIQPVNFESAQKSGTDSKLDQLRQYQQAGAEIICIVNWSAAGSANGTKKETEIIRLSNGLSPRNQN
ncbi:MAG: thioredoxin domain-containing protein [Planctomycetia bacterium]|nr:thioredoxin domain-containing protein [Planctomycetia bacterium]